MSFANACEVCANCGKRDGSGDLGLGDGKILLMLSMAAAAVAACYAVKYWDIRCEKSHRKIHRKAYKLRAAKLDKEKKSAAQLEKEAPASSTVDDGTSAPLESSEDTDREECGICLGDMERPVRLPCGHTFCQKCLDGWSSKYFLELAKRCPFCRRAIPPSREILNQIRTLRGCNGDMAMAEKMVKKLLQDWTREEIETMIEELPKRDKSLPTDVLAAMGQRQFQPVQDLLGKDPSMVNAKCSDVFGITLLGMATGACHFDFATLLLQEGAELEIVNDKGQTAFSALLGNMYAGQRLKNNPNFIYFERMLDVLLVWGAEIPREGHSGYCDAVEYAIQMTPLLQTEFGGRRCEVVGLKSRRDLIGKTGVVEKFIAKKGRYKIKMEHSDEAFLVGPNNLKRRDRTPKDPGRWLTIFNSGEFMDQSFLSNEQCQAFVVEVAGRKFSTPAEYYTFMNELRQSGK